MPETTDVTLLIAKRARTLPPLRAENFLRLSLEDFPESPVLWERLTETLLVLRRPHAAQAAFEHYWRFASDGVTGWRLKAEILLSLSQPGKALGAICQLHRRSPSDLTGWRLKAQALLDLNRCADALIAVDQLHRIAPEDLAGGTLKAAIYQKMGDHQRV